MRWSSETECIKSITIGWAVIWGTMALFAIVLYRNAWLGDDAYITFRTVDNFVNGYGLTWNPPERVQAFTHPLWMFVHSLFYFFTNEIFFTSLFISFFCTIMAAVVMVRRIAITRDMAILGLILLIGSKSFIDYSSSGLENPLSHLLFILFIAVYLNMKPGGKRFLRLCFIVSLAALNRLDSLLIYVPILAATGWDLPFKQMLKLSMVGFLPLIGWELFSLFYFGSLIPNTAYAKLNTGIDPMDLVEQGKAYLSNGWDKSPLTLLLMIYAAILTALRRDKTSVCLTVGMGLYLLYILKVGGDFMTGRFLTLPYLVAVVVVIRSQPVWHRWHKTGLLATAVALGFVFPRSPILSGADYGRGDEALEWYYGITDERAAWFQTNGLLNVKWDDELPKYEWADQGRQARANGPGLVARCGIGFFGYCAGPEVYVVDCHVLTDPLKSRLPVEHKKGWRIGHFRRATPEGYIEGLVDGVNRIEDRDLAEYYDRLQFVIRGPLFNWRRVKEAIKLNLGSYDHLLESYKTAPIRLTYDQICEPKASGTVWNFKGNTVIDIYGLHISFAEYRNDARLEISFDHNDEYEVIFFRDSIELQTVHIANRWIKSRGLRVDTLAVSKIAQAAGYNQLKILPVEGDGMFSVGHVMIIPDGGE